MATSNHEDIHFGEFEVDLRLGELRRHGARVPLQEQPFQVLAVLLERPGELVRREELRRQVWPEDTFVEFDHALNTAVKKIRIALGDCADSPCYVETIPKRGYRFIAQVCSKDEPEGKVEPVPNPWPGRWPASSRRIAILTALLFVSVAALLGWRWRTAAAKPIVLAVLPLEDWSDDAHQGLICDGIMQELITQSAKIEPARLAIVPSAASVQYRHTTKTVAEVAHELHADYLVHGTLRRSERNLRVTIELIRARDEARLWGDDFDREVGDSLVLEAEVAAAIVSNLNSALFPAQNPTSTASGPK
jgi:TolB-like protein/DNA-binding winged helix-turn-helix (wHTH) protein